MAISRYQIRKGPIECYHISDVSGKPVSVISVIDHNLTPEELAFYLTQAAAWFQQVAKKLIEPSQRSRSFDALK